MTQEEAVESVYGEQGMHHQIDCFAPSPQDHRRKLPIVFVGTAGCFSMARWFGLLRG